MSRSRFTCFAVIVLLMLVAFTVRAVSINAQSLWRDEVDALCYAYEFPHIVAQTLAPGTVKDLNTPCACPSLPVTPANSPDEGALLRLARTFGGMIRQNGPLYFFLLRGWIAGASVSEYAMRFFSLLFGVLGVPLVYVLGRRLFDRSTGLFAALLVTVSPYLTWYSQEVKMYALVSALVLLAIYGLRRAVEGDGWRWWAVQIVATSLAFYTHVLAALLVPVQILLYFAWWPQARKQWMGAFVSLACLTLPYLPLALWQAPQVFRARETGFYPYALGEMAKILLNGWSLGISSRGWPWGTVLMSALAVWGLVNIPSSSSNRGGLAPKTPAAFSIRQEADIGGVLGLSKSRFLAGGGRNRFALVCWLTVPLLAVRVISLWQPLFTDRYLIWTAPAFYLLIALGLSSIGRFGDWGRWTVVFLASITLVFSGANLWQQAIAPIKSDFRAAAAYVAGRHAPGELIVFQIPHGLYTFDYYFPKDEYPWAEGLYTNHRIPDGSYLMSEQNVAHRMQELTAAYDVVWLVATETTMWDERGLVQAWLEANGDRVDEAYFMWVDVYRYVK